MDWNEINEAIREKIDAATEGKDGDDFDEAKAEELKNMDRSARQFLFDGGHKAATKQKEGRLNQLEEEREGLRQDLEDARETIGELKEGQNDTELQNRIDALEDELEEKEEELESEKREHERERQESSKERFLARLRAKTSERISDEDRVYREINELKNEGRITHRDDGGIMVKQKGKEAPVMADSEDDLVDALAEEFVQRAPDNKIRGSADSGGGAQSGSGGGTLSRIEKARKDAEAKRDAKKGETKPLKEKLGMAA